LRPRGQGVEQYHEYEKRPQPSRSDAFSFPRDNEALARQSAAQDGAGAAELH